MEERTRTDPFEESSDELLLGPLSIEFTFLAQSDEVITREAQQALRRRICKLVFLTCESQVLATCCRW